MFVWLSLRPRYLLIGPEFGFERTSYFSLWYHGQRPDATHFPGRLIAVNNQVSVGKSRHRRAAVGR